MPGPRFGPKRKIPGKKTPPFTFTVPAGVFEDDFLDEAVFLEPEGEEQRKTLEFEGPFLLPDAPQREITTQEEKDAKWSLAKACVDVTVVCHGGRAWAKPPAFVK